MNDDNQTTPAKPWWGYKGMSAVEYAAIHLCQPISGTPWLDEAIAKARRERLAGQALAGLLVNYNEHPHSVEACADVAIDAAEMRLARAIIQDWADTDTAVRETCRKAGIDVDGTPAHVPDIPELVERLAKENAKLRAAADGLAEALNGCREDSCELAAERDWWKDEPRCGYSTRWVEMQSRIASADAAIAAYQDTKKP